MNRNSPNGPAAPLQFSRRRFVQGLVAGGVLTGLSGFPSLALAGMDVPAATKTGSGPSCGAAASIW
jgi:hypothetical protein